MNAQFSYSLPITILATPCLVQRVNESTNVRGMSEFYSYVFEIRFLYDSVRFVEQMFSQRSYFESMYARTASVASTRNTRNLVSEGNLTSVVQKDFSLTHTYIETVHSF